MTSALFSSLVLTALIAVASAQCGSQCRFRMCQSVGPLRNVGANLNLRAPKVPAQGPVICLENTEMVFVRRTGEAVLELPSGDVEISNWSPAGLSKKFKKSFFKAGKVQSLQKSSPIREATTGNQWDFLNNLCVKLPILQYEERQPFSVVTTAGDPEDCVSFTAIADRLSIEATWQSRDDLDLSITDPLGRTLSRTNNRAGDGHFGDDNAVGACESKPVAVGKERGWWPAGSDVPPGTYTITLRHFNNCGEGKTPYQIRAVLDGQAILFKNGKSTASGDAIITTQTIVVP